MTGAQELASGMLKPSALQHLDMGHVWPLAECLQNHAALQVPEAWMLLATQALGRSLYRQQ